jgi:hypothetical protein
MRETLDYTITIIPLTIIPLTKLQQTMVDEEKKRMKKQHDVCGGGGTERERRSKPNLALGSDSKLGIIWMITFWPNGDYI